MYQLSFTGPNSPSLCGYGPREVCRIWKVEVRQQHSYTQKAGLESGPTAAHTYCRPSAGSSCWCGERAKWSPGPGCVLLRGEGPWLILQLTCSTELRHLGFRHGFQFVYIPVCLHCLQFHIQFSVLSLLLTLSPKTRHRSNSMICHSSLAPTITEGQIPKIYPLSSSTNSGSASLTVTTSPAREISAIA